MGESDRREPESRSIWMDEWERLRPALPALTDGDTPRTPADVAIVGAGLTGLTLAYRLATAGKRVIVLEAREVGQGASLRSAGFCTASAPFSAQAAIQRHGAGEAANLLRWFFDAPAAVCCLLDELGAPDAWTPATRHVLARSNAQAHRLRTEAALLRSTLGRDIHYLGAQEIEPGIALGPFAGALYDPANGSVNPARLLAALLHGSLGAGVRILEQARAQEITRRAGAYRIRHSRGDVDAGQVVIATEGYTDALGFGSHKLLFPVGSFIVATHPLTHQARDRLARGHAVYSTACRLPNYFRLTPDGRLLFGGRRSASRKASTSRVARELQANVRRLLPGLEFQVDRCWGGRLGFTVHREPVMGKLDEQLYFLGGYCGHGIPTSIACAEDLARQLLGYAAMAPASLRRALQPSWHVPIASRLLPIAGAFYRLRDSVERLARIC